MDYRVSVAGLAVLHGEVLAHRYRKVPIATCYWDAARRFLLKNSFSGRGGPIAGVLWEGYLYFPPKRWLMFSDG